MGFNGWRSTGRMERRSSSHESHWYVNVDFSFHDSLAIGLLWSYQRQPIFRVCGPKWDRLILTCRGPRVRASYSVTGCMRHTLTMTKDNISPKQISTLSVRSYSQWRDIGLRTVHERLTCTIIFGSNAIHFLHSFQAADPSKSPHLHGLEQDVSNVDLFLEPSRHS